MRSGRYGKMASVKTADFGTKAAPKMSVHRRQPNPAAQACSLAMPQG
jgi:hypothetical protein